MHKIRKTRKNQLCLTSAVHGVSPFDYRAAHCGGVTRALTKDYNTGPGKGIQWPVHCSAKYLRWDRV